MIRQANRYPKTMARPTKAEQPFRHQRDAAPWLGSTVGSCGHRINHVVTRHVRALAWWLGAVNAT
jgi:hypothetical protein